jgi:hypothetical protein
MITQFGAWRLINLLGKGKLVYATCDPFDLVPCVLPSPELLVDRPGRQLP